MVAVVVALVPLLVKRKLEHDKRVRAADEGQIDSE